MKFLRYLNNQVYKMIYVGVSSSDKKIATPLIDDLKTWGTLSLDRTDDWNIPIQTKIEAMKNSSVLIFFMINGLLTYKNLFQEIGVGIGLGKPVIIYGPKGSFCFNPLYELCIHMQEFYQLKEHL